LCADRKSNVSIAAVWLSAPVFRLSHIPKNGISTHHNGVRSVSTKAANPDEDGPVTRLNAALTPATVRLYSSTCR
jgi:hypothetical protein